MNVVVTDDPALVLDRAAGFIGAEPFSANVLAVEASSVASGARPLRPGSAWFLIQDEGRVVGAAMHTPPFNLHLPRLGEAAVASLAAALVERGRTLPGVSGEATTVDRFLAHWGPHAAAPLRRRVAMRLYVLDRLVPPSGVPGRERKAHALDAELVAHWIEAFHHEAQPGAPGDDVDRRARASVIQGRMWLWELEGCPVSLAGSSTPAMGTARIGPVYTPPEHRCQGYGSAVTAAATQACLRAGATHVVLYTDLANPTSNAVYQSIGYRPDHDACEWELV